MVDGKRLPAQQGDRVFTFRVPLRGEIQVEAVAGQTQDTAVFRKVDTPDPSYVLPKKKNPQKSNWV